MTHEFKDIVRAHIKATQEGLKTVLATVVALDGSSYRKPGVRMLILENDEMIGAVSGGCVEKDILSQSQTVFHNRKSKMMTYDGRYRLGCEGILYILLEEFKPDETFFDVFENCLEKRQEFVIHSNYLKQEGVVQGIGSFVEIKGETYSLSNQLVSNNSVKLFSQEMLPCFKLMIFGAEHDAVKLCKLASFNGWDVTIVSGPLESKTIENFPGATAFYSVSLNYLELNSIDSQTAIVLMSHNFANDLKYLLELKDTQPVYIGMLGPSLRREKILSQFLEYCPEVEEQFLELIHGPAGLNIGAETPQEIAISILSEILSVVRSQKPVMLKEKTGGIHS